MRIALREHFRVEVARTPILHVADGKEEVVWHYAQNDGALAIHEDAAADDFGIAGKTPMPQGVTDDHGLAFRGVFFTGPRTAKKGLHLQDIEKVSGDGTSEGLLRGLVTGQAGGLVAKGSHVRKNLVLGAPVHIIGRRRGIVSEANGRGVFPYDHQPTWVAVGERPKKKGLYGAENGGVSANT